MKDCIFCKLVKGEIPRKLKLETDNLVVFPDIHPRAPIHLLIVPKKHVRDLAAASDKIWLEIKAATLKLAEQLNTSGFRIVNNSKAAQEVKHMHVHFLGEVGLEREL